MPGTAMVEIHAWLLLVALLPGGRTDGAAKRRPLRRDLEIVRSSPRDHLIPPMIDIGGPGIRFHPIRKKAHF
jgi:hypothetical protein